MDYSINKVNNIKIAYIGGGSRGWAWGLMSDLASAEDISGEVSLYDIDFEAAKKNVIIGNKFNLAEGARSKWCYSVSKTLKEALSGANFVVISILPGTFDEMESDVHAPEKFGIYQSVGDTVGPGGIMRALRTIPMIEEIATAIKNYSPNAWVINYTNPMSVCVRTLYATFPEIKAFGCCHEVFGTQKLLATMIDEFYNIKDVRREDVKVNVVGINHFTWLTRAQYKNIDLFPAYAELAKKYAETGYTRGLDDNWMNNIFECSHKVKFNLFNRFGFIAAAGDRHLAEFCPGKWYLESPQSVKEWGFGLTPVKYRKDNLKNRLEKSDCWVSGEETIKLSKTGEDGVNQIRALLGLEDMVTNVNIPNRGQIPNLPIGAIVETNAVFNSNSVVPCFAGEVPKEILGLISRIVVEQETVVKAGLSHDIELSFKAFINDPLVTINMHDARKLFDEMIDNTKSYLKSYQI